LPAVVVSAEGIIDPLLEAVGAGASVLSIDIEGI
jgi:hypothetical protein